MKTSRGKIYLAKVQQKIDTSFQVSSLNRVSQEHNFPTTMWKTKCSQSEKLIEAWYQGFYGQSYKSAAPV